MLSEPINIQLYVDYVAKISFVTTLFHDLAVRSKHRFQLLSICLGRQSIGIENIKIAALLCC